MFDKVSSDVDDWNVTRALSVILRVCEALAFAHAKGVIHRDIKPGNIMVGRFGEVYVTDFAIAREQGKQRARLGATAIPLTLVRTERRYSIEGDAKREPSTASPISPGPPPEDSVIGPAEYMPPEQTHGRLADIGVVTGIYAHLRARSDVVPRVAGVSPYHTPSTAISYARHGIKDVSAESSAARAVA